MNIFTYYFNELNKTNIVYAITGQTKEYPENIYSDIDIIIPKEFFSTFWSFMKDMAAKEIQWVQVISHEFTAYYSVVSLSDGKKHHLLKPDVCSDYYRNGHLFLEAKYLLSERVFNAKGFYQLAPEKEFVYYLLKKIDKGNISQKQFNHLVTNWNLNRQGCITEMSGFFTKESQKQINKSLTNNDIESFKSSLTILKTDLHQSLKFSLKDFILKIGNRIARIRKPTGLIIVFMGPDGAGKTTIINGVKKDMTEVFRQNKQFHLFPKETSGTSINTNPQGVKPRGYFGSLLKLFYFFFLYVVGYWKKILPLKIRSTLVIFDRYYHDLLVDPIRYRHGAGQAWLQLISFFIPKPDIWILLDAPADIIQARKSEVTLQETVRQLEVYKKLFSTLKNSYIINANQDPEKVIYDTEKVILDFLTERTSKHYKNK